MESRAHVVLGFFRGYGRELVSMANVSVPAQEGVSGRYRGIAILVALAGYTLVNMDSGFFANGYQYVANALHLTSVQIGDIYAVSYFLGGFAALALGLLADVKGRKLAFAIAMIGVSLGSLLTGFATGFILLALFRLLSQMSASSEPVVGNTLATEESAAKTRGIWFSFQQSGYPLGFFLASIISALVLPTLGWHWLFIIGTVPVLVVLFSSRLLREPPRFQETSVKVFGSFRKVGLLFSTRATRRTSIPLVLYFLMLAFGTSIQFWIPSLAQAHHMALARAPEIQIIGTAGGLVGYLFNGWLGDRIGRKLVGIIMSILGILATFGLLTIAQGFLGMALVYAIWWFGAMGQWAATLSLAAESFPTEIRATGVGLCTWGVWLGVAISGLVDPRLGTLLGIGGALTLVGVGGLFLAIVFLALKPTVQPGMDLTDLVANAE
jgi:MFS family permease